MVNTSVLLDKIDLIKLLLHLHWHPDVGGLLGAIGISGAYF